MGFGFRVKFVGAGMGMEIKVPEVGESVFEARIVVWHKQQGEAVRRDEPVCEIETDKITLEINAEADGVLSILAQEGATVRIGDVIGSIESAAPAVAAAAPVAAPVEKVEIPPLSPSVRKMAQEKGISPETLTGTGKGGRVTVDDLLSRLHEEDHEMEELERLLVPEKRVAAVPPPEPETPAPRPAAVSPSVPPLVVRTEEPVAYAARKEDPRTTRTAMSPIRKRIAERLLMARQQTAMVTTFNEADMSKVVALRKRHREQFQKKHGVTLGFMPFFVKACVEALREFPAVNARIDGGDIVYQHFFDIGIAVSGEKGLVVPVIHDADRLHFAEIEGAIERFVEKIKTNTLTMADLEGGTFTVSNGGIYGSLMSTPILNPPQSGVLGMHAIQDRPVAVKGKVVVRPMMYLALSYDHRIIDGREAVGFLRTVKEYIENPEEMLLEG
jgi:2-oxoglutarate dehydrogenase E2 component (dihydrolipoamide succinyltransferase)